LYIANFVFGNTSPVSPSFFISLNDGLSSTVNFIVFPSTVNLDESLSSPSSFISFNFNVPSTISALNLVSFTFAYPAGANTSFNVYVWSILLSASY